MQKNVIAKWQLLENNHKSNQGFSPYYPNANAGMLHILVVGSNSKCMFGAKSGHCYGVEKRGPTADKRVLEYCLSIPNEVFFDKKGNGKQVLRRLTKNRLPDEVLFEKKKGLQSANITTVPQPSSRPSLIC